MIDLAIMGYGRWGSRLVGSVQGKSDKVRFSHIVTRSPEKMQAEAGRLNVVVRATLKEVLADPDVDGIVLATPHSLHEEQIAACAKAGKPVLAEKPFTMTRDAAARALSHAAPELVVAVGHNRRFLPAVRRMKQEIETGRIGKTIFVEANYSGNVAESYRSDQWRVQNGESPAGGLAGAGIHMIDLIVHLCGPIISVVAGSRRNVLEVPMDDTTSAMFWLESGAGASLTTLMATASTFRLQVFGSRGSVELRGSDILDFTDLDGKTETLRFDSFDVERAEIEAFAAAIAGAAAYPVTRAEIVNGVAAFEGVSRSVETNQWIRLG